MWRSIWKAAIYSYSNTLSKSTDRHEKLSNYRLATILTTISIFKREVHEVLIMLLSSMPCSQCRPNHRSFQTGIAINSESNGLVGNPRITSIRDRHGLVGYYLTWPYYRVCQCIMNSQSLGRLEDQVLDISSELLTPQPDTYKQRLTQWIMKTSNYHLSHTIHRNLNLQVHHHTANIFTVTHSPTNPAIYKFITHCPKSSSKIKSKLIHSSSKQSTIAEWSKH